MKNEITKTETISAEISKAELESIAASFPVQSNVKAGAAAMCRVRPCYY